MTKFGLAQPVRRVEDPRLLKGEGRYTDDIDRPGLLFGVVVRSPHAAAGLGAIDTAAARALPGVAAVFTGADLAAAGVGPLHCAVPMTNRDGSAGANPPHPALALGFVRHVGDAVAFVVAETLAQARDGAEAVGVSYEVSRSITDLGAAMADDAAQVWPDAAHNLAFDWEVGDRAKTEALFAEAAHVTRLAVVNNRIIASSMETRGAVAEYDAAGGRWTLFANTQGGWLVKEALAGVFGTAQENFRIVTPDVGGAFGMKIFPYPEHVCLAFAARALGRPVKWIADRAEAFVSDTHGRDNLTLGELAVDGAGKFLALRTRNIANMGAYLSTYAPFIPTYAGTVVLASVYGFKSVYANVLGVFTHTVPVDAYRGAGRPESNYLVERLVDQVARDLGIDRVELRRRNMVPPAAMPWSTPVGGRYDSGDFVRVLDAAAAKMNWAGFGARRADSARRGLRRGIGLAYYLEATGGPNSERAEIVFAADGMVDVYVGTQSAGQGHETAYVQLTSDRLGIAGEKIRIRQGDTDRIPVGGGTGGARSLYSEGQAILLTAASVIAQGKRAASEALEAAVADIVFEEGRFSITGTDRGMDILSLAATQRERRAAGQEATLLDAAEIAAIDTHTYPNGCHMAEVEVDPETGAVTILRYIVVDDVGRAINPMIVRGQVHGGVAQGFGQAMRERTVYDRDSGQLLSGSFMDYALPRADDLPDIEVDLIEIPCATNPLGVKGAGEAGAVGSPPAVMNAIIDAVSRAGVPELDMPATPEKVWKALASAAAAAP